MTGLELLATGLSLVSVLLTVHLRKGLYPVGILSTILFLFVFWKAKLYASAALQIYYTLIQFYGWWFWAKGDRGREPPVGDWPWARVALIGSLACAATVAIAIVLYRFTDAKAPAADTAILALSVLAQFLLDRKQLKSWIVWGVVDLLSIQVYAGQGLWLTTALYGFLFLNAFYGWAVWRKALAAQSVAA